MEKLIDQFHKSSIEIVKIRLTEWRSKSYIDIRVFFLENAADVKSAKPSKKGIALSIDHLPSLIEALKKAQKILEESERA